MKKGKNTWADVGIVGLCIAALLVEFLKIPWTGEAFLDEILCKLLQQVLGTTAVILLMLRLKIRLFGGVKNWLYLLPCLLVAVDNFPFYSYFQGNMQWVRTGFWDICLFAVYCLSVGVFEECVFRGVLFSLLASYFSKDRKGFLKTYFFSSALFGAAHLLNLLSGNVGAVVLQICYSTLTGGLFAYVMIKTQNVLCGGVLHGLYNFCGLLLSERGLGAGVVFDFGTGLIMTIVSIAVGIFVLKTILQYKDEERTELYEKLHIQQ